MSTPIGQTNMGGSSTRSGEGQTQGAQSQAQTQGMSGQGLGSQGMGGQSQAMSKNQGHQEGPIARTIEQQTAKLPSDTFLWAAVGSIGASALLRMMGKKNASLFVGDWVAPMLLFGVYNKIVKLHGSDRGH